jgi:ABC-type multidrug transport system fused ATPase/permease subunit
MKVSSILVVIGLIGRLCLLANTNVIGLWVDSFCRPSETLRCHPLPQFAQHFSNKDYVLLLLALSGMGFICIFTFRVIFSVLSAQAISQIYDETTFRTSRQPMSFFDNTPVGRIVTRFSSDYGNVFRLFGGPLAGLFSICFDLIAMLILISLASPYYLPIILVVTLCNYLIYKINIKGLREARRNLSASRSPSIAHFAETAQGASTIRAFIKQKSFATRFRNLDLHYLMQRLFTTRLILLFSFQINCMTSLLLLTTGFLAWWLLLKGVLTIGSIGVAFSFIALSGGTVQMFFEWMSQFEEAMVGVERLDHYLRQPLESGAHLPSAAHLPSPHFRHSSEDERMIETSSEKLSPSATVSFEDIWLRYREDLPFVLKGLSFQIEAGEKFGIIGRTGSGKSSLIQALFYLYPLQKGTIRVNGKAPALHLPAFKENEIDLQLYRRHLAFIAQDPTLFRGTLRENLALDLPASDEKLFSVLTQVGLSEWASAEGLNQPVEERGRNLSQGERQLLCMARCLLQDAPVVVMDEATSSVDPQSEEILVKATEEFFRGKTQIIIAHRLSTLLNCDRILWLQNGEIHMIGTPDEVLPIFQRSNLTEAVT